MNSNNSIAKFSTATGDWWLPTDNDIDIIIKAMKSGEVFEPEIIDSASTFIKPGSTVLDIGSNFGQMAVLFSRLVGPKGKVYAFEADEFIFNLLCRNIKENNRKNIEPVFGAVWDNDGLELFYPEPDFERFGSYGSYGIDLNAKEGRKVRSFTIDSLNITSPISLIKIDIQGSDLFALKGARKTIEREQPVIIFEFEEQFQKEFGTSLEDYEDFIRDINYKIIGKVDDIAYAENFIVAPRKNIFKRSIELIQQTISYLYNKNGRTKS